MDSSAEEKKDVTIIVNTREHVVPKGKISYQQVVDLAFPTPPGPEPTYTVTYSKGAEPKPTGTLVAGQSVEDKNGMIFSVTPTNKS